MTEAQQALLIHDSCSDLAGAAWETVDISVADDCHTILVWYGCCDCGARISVLYEPMEVTEVE